MILIFLFLLLFSNGLTIRPDTSVLYSRIGIAIVFYSYIATLNTFHLTYLDKGISLYGGLFNVTSITHTFQMFIFLVCGLILFLTGFYPRKKYVGDTTTMTDMLFNKLKQYASIINKVSEQFTIIEYALIIIFVITGATLLITSADMGSIYLSIELQSFSLYIISSLHRNSESSTGSALTYFLLGGLSSCFILLGIVLMYANSGLTNLDGIYALITDSEKYIVFSKWYIHTYLFFSLLLISVGFLFKIAAAPFHWWSPDVYDGVPTIVTTFISIMGKISVLILLLTLVHYTSNLLYSSIQVYSWTTSLSISCFFSLIIGTLLGLTQIRIKRLLAYSTISHVGFILLALIAYSIESEKAFIFYIVQYILTSLNSFMVIIGIGFSLYLYFSNVQDNNTLSEKNNSPVQLISQLKGFFSINPVLALCLVVSMFSFVGLPPLVGFFGKQMVLTAALDNHKTVLVIIAILTSVIGAVYYLNVVKNIYFDHTEYEKSYVFVNTSLSNIFSINLSFFLLLITLFILYANEITGLTEILSVHNYTSTYCNASQPWDLFFQDNASPQMEGLEELHNNITFLLVAILFAISWIIVSIILNYNKAKIYSHGTLVELIWTISPALILILIAFPSFKLLYLMDEVIDPSLVINGENHEWYWSYQYPDFVNKDEQCVEYDSYIIPEYNIEKVFIIHTRPMEEEENMIKYFLSKTEVKDAGDRLHPERGGSPATEDTVEIDSSTKSTIPIIEEVKEYCLQYPGTSPDVEDFSPEASLGLTAQKAADAISNWGLRESERHYVSRVGFHSVGEPIPEGHMPVTHELHHHFIHDHRNECESPICLYPTSSPAPGELDRIKAAADSLKPFFNDNK